MQRVFSTLLQGGLDLVTPPIALAPGSVIAALNYEPETLGYRRIGGYERYDGRPSPSDGADASEIATRRAAIGPVPGEGQVRGVWIYKGALWAFRDSGGVGKMYKASTSGWVEQSFGHVVDFNAGVSAFAEGETVTGGTSGATGTVKRAVTRSGNYAAAPNNTATGYLVIADKSGDFTPGETITSAGGEATTTGSQQIQLIAGGAYVFAVHNFYGPTKSPRLYLANGVNTAMEWDGTVLAPARSGTADGPIDLADEYALTRGGAGGYVLTRDGGRVLLRYDFDRPVHVAQFANHLFLGFRNGGVVFSGVGEPLDYRTDQGAGEFGFSDEITAFLDSAATALVIFGQNRIEYVTGTDKASFLKQAISDGSGAYARTAQMLEQPYFLDDAGVRALETTSAFGDWRMGTVTRAVEPMIRAKFNAGVAPNATVKVKHKDQYRLFWNDGSGLVVYFGRERPETLPFKLPITVTCACSGELGSEGERVFVGASDGYVYELDKGTSFDGASISAYLRLAWTGAGSALQNKRFHKVAFEIDAPSAATIGLVAHADFSRRDVSAVPQEDISVDAGTRLGISTEDYASIDWLAAEAGVLEAYLDTFGRNIALTLVSETATEEPHTLSAMSLNYMLRSLVR